ncbi:MAG: helix-hairpin-helix domain-containing protein [Clostridiales bacterium]|nr:helix-hairpin-helix domain-containing protein [Clostridiales bacterium]
MKFPVIPDRIRSSAKYCGAFVLIVAIGVIYKFVCRGNFDGLPVTTSGSGTDISETDATSSLQSDNDEISIYICGEVNDPGIYKVPSGTILNDVAQLAGGFTEDAALEDLNLVYQLSGNLSIYIPSYGTLGEADSFILRRGSTSSDVSDNDNGLININTASLDQLVTLPGVGESLGQSIIDYRGGNRFDSVEDIMNVSGIGEAKFNKIKDRICV